MEMLEQIRPRSAELSNPSEHAGTGSGAEVKGSGEDGRGKKREEVLTTAKRAHRGERGGREEGRELEVEEEVVVEASSAWPPTETPIPPASPPPRSRSPRPVQILNHNRESTFFYCSNVDDIIICTIQSDFTNAHTHTHTRTHTHTHTHTLTRTRTRTRTHTNTT